MQVEEHDTERLQVLVKDAIDYLAPHFNLMREQLWYPRVKGTYICRRAPNGLKTLTYDKGELTLA
jgi:hypothetical protein